MNGFSEESKAVLFTEEGENICPPNKIVHNVFLLKNIVIDIYEYSVKIIFRSLLRVIVRENQAILKNLERWGTVDSHHIFAVRHPYPTDTQGSILFSIALIGFEYDHPP